MAAAGQYEGLDMEADGLGNGMRSGLHDIGPTILRMRGEQGSAA
jgi:hypothetical protein